MDLLARRALRGSTLLPILLLGLAAPVMAESVRSSGQPHVVRTLRYDVSMNGASFFFEGATNENGYPADGTPFVVRGYLYPPGTFAAHGATSGTLPDGSPEFPEPVKGTWYRRGWHLQDGDALTGPVVATTQVFDLDLEHPAAHTVVTDGIELADFDVFFQRAITGGTGRYRNATGQLRQVYRAVNASQGFNTSFVLHVVVAP
jgi:hypothetical protein